MSEKPEIVRFLQQKEAEGKLGSTTSSAYLLETPDSPDEQTPSSSFHGKELGDLQEQYRLLFENYAVAITIADEQERIVSWNTYAEELLHMNEKDLFMRPVQSLYPAEEWKKIRQENIRQKGIKFQLETKMTPKNSQNIDVEVSLCILRGAHGKNSGSLGLIKDISRLKKTERKLKQSEEKYRTIFENSAVAIMLTDEQERIISWNTYAETMLEMTDKELHLTPVQSLYPPEEWKKIRSQNIRKKGMQHHLETQMILPSGCLLDVDVSLSVLKDHEGAIIGSIGVIKDITEQKQMKQALQQSESKFKQLYEKAPIPYHTLDAKGCITDVNDKWRKTLGYNKKDVVGKTIFDFIKKDEREQAKASFQEKINQKNPYAGGHERRFLTKKGKEKIFLIHDFLSYDQDHNVTSVHTTMEDITNRKNVETNLKQSEEKYRAIFELSPQLIFLVNDTGIVLDINGKVEEWLKYKPKEIIGTPLHELPFLPDRSRTIIKQRFSQRMKGKTIPPYSLLFRTSYGDERTGMIYGNPIRDKDNHIVGDLVVISDITDRQKAWDSMVKSEEKYRVLAETSADGVFTTDNLGRLTYVNPSLEKMLGRRKSTILATLIREYLSDNSVYLFQQTFMEVRKHQKKINNVELEFMHQEGYTIPIEVNIAPLKKDKKFAGLECTVRDITERKKIEWELKKSEQLKTEFMNIAAHELKSPVTPIKGYLELIATDKDVPDKAKKWAEISLRNAERLLNLVNDILDVSRLDTDTMRFTMEKLDPRELVLHTIEDMQLAAEKKNLQIKADVPDTLPGLLGDFHRLSQVLKNLLVNAIKFTDNGSITVKASSTDDALLISVEDTGIGISPDQQKRVFTKFYQGYTGDDRRNEGAGLGLFICKEIVKKHRGKLWVESQIGKGSTFTVKLPY